MMAVIDRHLFVIFGGTSDLAERKLIPSLYRLVTEGGLGEKCVVLGVARADIGDEGYRKFAGEALDEAGFTEDEAAAWCEESLFYHSISSGDDAFGELRRRIDTIEADEVLPGNRVFYLALPHQAFASTVSGLGEIGLDRSPGWTRVVIEKPFGTDLGSARDLNQLVLSHFDESQVYRIDHYLGKATVQNLLTFRFTNPMFERLWNRDQVEQVEITVSEDLGIGSRAGYYESAGVIRDMMQNHLTQLLALVAMEPPNRFEADLIRDEKVKVVEAIAPINPDDVVLGQYDAGTINGSAVKGYRQERGVDSGSVTPTFAGMRLFVDTWRWEGVPFYLRTGKRLAKRFTQIAVTFRGSALCVLHGRRDDCRVDRNVLLITLQPDEGFVLRFNVNSPEMEGKIDARSLHFRYAEAYQELPEAYDTLILDILEGDQTLFVRDDEVEVAWRACEPMLELRPDPILYAAGTWGPAVMAQGVPLEGGHWMNRGTSTE